MKKILISLILLIFLMSIVTSTYALSAKTELSLSGDENKTVIKGTEFYCYISIEPDDNSYVDGFQANLLYDKSKLSIVKTMANLAPYEDIYNGTKIGMKHKEDFSGYISGLSYTILFKVLETGEDGETDVTIGDCNIDLINKKNNTKETFQAENKSITVTLKTDNENLEQKNEMYNILSSYQNNINNKESNNINTNNNIITNNIKETKLPQTGVEMISVIAIVVLGTMGIASYISYRKYKNI